MKKTSDRLTAPTADCYYSARIPTGGIVFLFFLALMLTWSRAIADCGEPEPPDYIPLIIIAGAISSLSFLATFLTIKFWNEEIIERPVFYLWPALFLIYLIPITIMVLFFGLFIAHQCPPAPGPSCCKAGQMLNAPTFLGAESGELKPSLTAAPV